MAAVQAKEDNVAETNAVAVNAALPMALVSQLVPGSSLYFYFGFLAFPFVLKSFIFYSCVALSFLFFVVVVCLFFLFFVPCVRVRTFKFVLAFFVTV